MPTALLLACGDLFERRVFAVLVWSLAITVALFVGLVLLLAWSFTGADPCDAVGVATCPLDGTAGGVGAGVVGLLAIWFLFPAVALGVLAAFAEQVVSAVEARHYPAAARAARPLGAVGMTLLSLRSSTRLLLANLVALPFYAVLLFTGIGPAVLFVLVNGWAAGRDFGEMVSYRHGDRPAARQWLRASRGERAAVGVVCACLFLIPFLNLLAPVLGAAAVTHLYHRNHREKRPAATR